MPRPPALLALTLLAACKPDTTRPAVTPYPEAVGVEIRLRPQEATRRLAEALQADSLPPAQVRLRDGYLETKWLDSATGRPTGRRPLGTDVVRLRGWADPGRPGFTVLTVETVYRPLADPSLPERVEQILQAMLKRYGGPPAPEATQPAGEARPAPADEEAGAYDQGE